jgi:glycosyltransferase involved in cell wall biosynthesis
VRISLVSNFWYRRGGLERVMFADSDGLSRRGHVVAPFASAHGLNEMSPYARYFPECVNHGALGLGQSFADRARIAIRIVHNSSAVASFDDYLDEFRPDVVQQHGTTRQLSPSVLLRARSRGIPTVLTLHDHGLRCPSAILSRPGAPVCVEVSCAGHRYDRAVRFKCIHGSRVASSVAAIELLVHRALRRYERAADLFVVPSHYLAMRMRESGLPRDRVHVVVNAIEPSERTPSPLGSAVVAYGRLVDYKGFRLIVQAAEMLPNTSFVIGGDGPARESLEAAADGLRNVEFVGSVRGDQLERLLDRARMVVVPSTAPEGFGMVVLEAWRAGRPTIVTRRGALPEVVDDGRTGLVIPGEDPVELVRAVRALQADNELAREIGRRGLRETETTYSLSTRLDHLEETYRLVIEAHTARGLP